MTKILLLLSLIITPFLLPPLTILPFLPIIDGGTRPPKEVIALLFALSIFLSALYRGEIKSFNNKWYMIFMLYITFSILHSPPFITLLGQHNIAGSWQWKSFSYFLIYISMIVTISNIKFSKYEMRRIFSIITIVGVVMALYVILQKLNIDQFFKVKPIEIIGHPMNPNLMGTMGNASLVSAFLVMCLPFCYYLRKWGRALISIIAILLCQSQMSTGTMIVASALYAFIFASVTRPYLGTLCVVLIIGSTWFGITHPKEFRSKIGDNSRFALWEQTVEDIGSPPISQKITPGMTAEQKQYLTIQNDRSYPFTGIGLGSFKIMYSEKHKEVTVKDGRIIKITYPKWGSPHNLYIHIVYCIGIIGLGLFFMIIWTTMWPAFIRIKDNPDIFPIFISVISVLILSIGTFIIEIEPTRLYAAIFLGLLLNNSFRTFSYGNPDKISSLRSSDV